MVHRSIAPKNFIAAAAAAAAAAPQPPPNLCLVSFSTFTTAYVKVIAVQILEKENE